MPSRHTPEQGSSRAPMPQSPQPAGAGDGDDDSLMDIARGPRRARRQPPILPEAETLPRDYQGEVYDPDEDLRRAEVPWNPAMQPHLQPNWFPAPEGQLAAEAAAAADDDDDSDLDNNTFAYENASGDDEQFEFGPGSGDELLIRDLMDDPELGGGLTDVHDIDDEEHQADLDQIPVNTFDAAALGLKEINNLAGFRVSTYKPGNGKLELLDDSLDKYWQSDGTQPHRLTIKFIRFVEIRAIRFYVDYNQDESYTPTHILWYAGTGEHNLIKFAESTLTNPVGWQDVQIAGAGGGNDGNSLFAFVVQMRVIENHQNGKDTHIRGIKLYGFDERADPGELNAVHEMSVDIDAATDRATQLRLENDEDEEALFNHRVESIERSQNAPRYKPGEGGLSVPDFMEDPIIR